MLTDTLNSELRDVGPEDVLEQPKLEMLYHELTKQVNINDLVKIEKSGFGFVISLTVIIEIMCFLSLNITGTMNIYF